MRVVRALVLVSLVICGATFSAATTSIANAQAAPASMTTTADPDYKIGALDELHITVFQVDELTLKEARVDASGLLAFPLIGTLTAAGKTPSQLAAEIASKLQNGFLQSPQVSVIVTEAVSQKVTVDGAVGEPGVFELKGKTTLMQAIAMAKGASRTANLKRVVVFRAIGGEKNVAVFDLSAIRAGRTEDPEIYGNDIVVVDGSAAKGAWREIVSALPALAIFRPY